MAHYHSHPISRRHALSVLNFYNEQVVSDDPSS